MRHVFVIPARDAPFKAMGTMLIELWVVGEMSFQLSRIVCSEYLPQDHGAEDRDVQDD